MRCPGLLLAAAVLLLLAVAGARPSTTALGSPLDAALAQGGSLAEDAPLRLPSQPGEPLDGDSADVATADLVGSAPPKPATVEPLADTELEAFLARPATLEVQTLAVWPKGTPAPQPLRDAAPSFRPLHSLRELAAELLQLQRQQGARGGGGAAPLPSPPRWRASAGVELARDERALGLWGPARNASAFQIRAGVVVTHKLVYLTNWKGGSAAREVDEYSFSFSISGLALACLLGVLALLVLSYAFSPDDEDEEGEGEGERDESAAPAAGGYACLAGEPEGSPKGGHAQLIAVVEEQREPLLAKGT